MAKLCFVLLTLFPLYASSQSIFLTSDFQKGIYANAKEFLTNSPSISLEGITIKSTNKYLATNLIVTQSEWDDRLKRDIELFKGDVFTLEVKELFYDSTNKKVKRKDYWGFCDGQRVYINSREHIKSWHYVGLYFLGRYSYFKQTGTPTMLSNDRHNNYFAMDEYVVDSNTGKIIRLSRRELKKILVNAPLIQYKLNNGRYGRNPYQRCISEYNQAHQKDIKIPK